MGVGLVRIGEQLGRELTDDDVELVNWAQAEFARSVSGIDYAQALAANVAFRRAVQQWWADGFDLLLTPTLGEPPVPLGTFANDPASPMAPMVRAASVRAVHAAVQLERPAGDQPAAALDARRPARRRPTGRRLRRARTS